MCGIYSPDPFSRTLGWKSSFKVNPPGGSTSKTVSDPNIKRLLRPCVTVRDTAVAPAFHELPTEPETGCSAVTAAPLAATLMHSPRGDPKGRAFVPP